MSHRRRPRDPIPGPGDSRGGSGHGSIATARGPERPEALFFGLMLAVHGLPALLVYRGALALRQRVQTALITTTALPVLIPLGLRNGTMLAENAAALVGAGVLTVLVFPAAAVALGPPAPDRQPDPD
jgi:hypothetical protein